MPRKSHVAAPCRLPSFALLGVWLLAFVLYLPSVGYEFTFDDGVIVERNPAVQEWGHWQEIFCSEYWPGGQSALYRPLTILSFAVERLIHGSSPAGFHLANVILHSSVSVLVLLIAAELVGSGWSAVLAAALFAVHPIHTEVVSGIVGRAELLSSLLALWAFLHYVRTMRAVRTSLHALLGVPLLFFLAMCSKENAIVLPALLLMWELSQRGEQAAWQRIQKLVRNPAFLGLLFAVMAFLLLRTAILGGFRASLNPNPPFVENSLAHAPPAIRILNAVANQAHGLRLHIFPYPQLADYSYRTLQTETNWLTPGFMLMVLLTILILALWLLKYRDTKNLAFASSWYVGALFPTSNILFAIGTIFGERLYYLPSVGFCLCLAILWDMVARRCVEGWTVPRARSGKAALGFALGMILALGLATWLRNPVWSNDRSLFEDTVARAPLNAKARLWLADSLVRSGDFSASVAEYRKALEIFPEYGAPAANMIVPLLRLNRLSEAIETGEKARALFPEANAVVLYNLGLAYLKAGDQARFLEYMQGVLKVDPQNSDAELQMGMFYLQHEKNGQEARKHLMEALRLNPNSQHASEIRRWLSEFR